MFWTTKPLIVVGHAVSRPAAGTSRRDGSQCSVTKGSLFVGPVSEHVMAAVVPTCLFLKQTDDRLLSNSRPYDLIGCWSR